MQSKVAWHWKHKIGLSIAGLLILLCVAGVLVLKKGYIENAPMPEMAAFKGPEDIDQAFTIKSSVRVTQDETSPDWLRVVYRVELTNVSDTPVRNFVSYGWIDSMMKRWIYDGIFIIGPHPDDTKPIDLIPGQIPYGVRIFRGFYIPHPSGLAPSDIGELQDSLQQPIWIRVSWEKNEHHIRIPPSEIEFIGLDLLKTSP